MSQPHRPMKYPHATIALYGPDDKQVTKVAIAVVAAEGAEPTMESWVGPDVSTNPDIQAKIGEFIKSHGARQVTMGDGIVGCPHEAGVDYPKGQDCPHCPYWRGRQGLQIW